MRWVTSPAARRGDNISHTLHHLHKPSSLPLTPWNSKQHVKKEHRKLVLGE
jgi:hypothetical protein